MTTIITVVIAALSLSLSTYVAIRNNRKADDKDIADKVARDTRIDLKLEEISNYVKEMRDDYSDTKRQFTEMNRQLVIVEQSVKSAHHRIDRMEGKEET
jgi:septal ring factor EnvC (AmiA/AmiB activator)